jgi:bifunctional non-homologous end joining protein LigD
VRLITRSGNNWTDRYAWIVETARKVREKRFLLISDFNALHSPRSASC